MIQNVICIDDDKVASLVLKISLIKCNFCSDIQTFLDGSLAMDYLISLQASPWENRFPDVIFLDLNMSQMDGWDFLEEYEKVYAKDHPESRILVLTSSLNPEDRKKVMNYPFVLDFISKPISVNLLAQIKQNQFFAARFD